MPKEPKTRPTDVPPASFIEAVPDPRRKADAQTALALLQELSGEPPVMWGPSIVGFGTCRLATGDWPRIGFSPRKSEIVFYLSSGFEQTGLYARLGKARHGVSCLYIKRLSDVDPGVLRELCQWSLDQTDAATDASC